MKANTLLRKAVEELESEDSTREVHLRNRFGKVLFPKAIDDGDFLSIIMSSSGRSRTLLKSYVKENGWETVDGWV